MKTWHLVVGSLVLNYLSAKYVNAVIDKVVGPFLP